MIKANIIKWVTERRALVACLQCGKEFEEYRSHIYDWGTGTSCSNMCKDKGRLKDSVSYRALHDWVRSRKPKPDVCADCKTAPPRDLANISQQYRRDINDFEWLCRKCHMTKDGRLENLTIANRRSPRRQRKV